MANETDPSSFDAACREQLEIPIGSLGLSTEIFEKHQRCIDAALAHIEKLDKRLTNYYEVANAKIEKLEATVEAQAREIEHWKAEFAAMKDCHDRRERWQNEAENLARRALAVLDELQKGNVQPVNWHVARAVLADPLAHIKELEAELDTLNRVVPLNGVNGITLLDRITDLVAQWQLTRQLVDGWRTEVEAANTRLVTLKAERDERNKAEADTKVLIDQMSERAEAVESLVKWALQLLDTTEAERQTPWWRNEKREVLAKPLALRLGTEK